jgi:hypothetical protein
MTVLAGILIFGIGIGFLPWRPVAVLVALAGLTALAMRLFGADAIWHPVTALMAPALLLGWACGLLIRRTIAERKAAT